MGDSKSERVGDTLQIAPFNGRMVNAHHRHFENVWSMDLNPKSVEKFGETCRGEGLPDNTIVALLIIVKELIHYRLNRSRVVLSGRELNKAITNVSSTARALAEALNDLVRVDFDDAEIIEQLMNSQRDKSCHGEDHPDYVYYIDVLQAVSGLMSHCAGEYVLLPQIAARNKSNKPPTLSGEVAILQRAHKIVSYLGHTFRVYKGGPFHRVCDALYAAAEMRQGSGAEGAITQMMRARSGAGCKEKLQHLKPAKRSNGKP